MEDDSKAEDMMLRESISLHPRFVTTPEDVTVKEGNEAHLNCTVIGQPSPVVTWKLFGSTLKSGDRRKFDECSSNVTLCISPTKWYDSGRYEVVAANPLGEVRSCVYLCVEPLETSPHEFDGSPIFLRRTQSKMLKVGTTITFKCNVTGIPQPQVRWKRGDTLVADCDNCRYQIVEAPNGSHSFIINQARLIDCGKYTCIAENSRGVAICAAFLKAGESEVFHENICYEVPSLCPIFITRPYSTTIREGHVASFHCTIHGVPQPTLTWYRSNGARILDDEHFCVEHLLSHHTLRVTNVRMQDSGSYFCTALNKAGEASCSVRLNVLRRLRPVAPSVGWCAVGRRSSSPTCRESSSSRNLVLNEGKKAKISLTVRGTPAPEVKWYKDGSIISTKNRYRLYCSKSTYQLQISKVCREDEGLIYMTALNPGGMFTTLLHISVKKKKVSVAKLPSSVLSVQEGADAFLHCTLPDEKEDATWWKDEKYLCEDPEKYEMLSERSMRQLVVRSVTSRDSGEYTCRVAKQSAVSLVRVYGDDRDGIKKNTLQDGTNVMDASKPKEVKDLTQVNSCNTNMSAQSPVRIVSGLDPCTMDVPETGTLIIQHTLSEAVEECFWSLAGKKLKNEGRCKIRRNGLKHSLMMLKVCLEDAGDVVFSLPGSDASVTTTVRIQELPPAPVLSDIAAHDDDTSIRLSWRPITLDDVKCIIDVQSSSPSEWDELGGVPSSKGEFIVENLKPGVSYKFRLRSQNSSGFNKDYVITPPVTLKKSVAIIQGLQDSEVEEGNTVTFSVHFNQPGVTGTWYLNGLKLILREDFCKMVESGNVHSLVMKNFSEQGEATVQFVTCDGSQSSSARLLVIGKAVKILKKMSDVTVHKNGEAIFTVALSQKVKVLPQWFYQGAVLSNSDEVTMTSKGEYQSLCLRNVKHSGDVQFKLQGEPLVSCSAKLNVVEAFEKEQLQMTAASLPDTTSSTPGGDAVLAFKSYSDEECQPLWSHKGAVIPAESGKYKIDRLNNVQRLTIYNITSDDEGVVQCVHGKQRQSTYLSVKKQENVPALKSPYFVSGSERIQLELSDGDRNIEMTCELSKDDVKVEWRKDDVPIDVNNDLFKISATCRKRSLVLLRVIKSTAGVYDCVIVDHKVKKKTYDVFVKDYSFAEEDEESDHSFTEGDKGAGITFHVTHPDTVVEWRRNNTPIDLENKNFLLVTNDCTRKIIFCEVTSDVEGNYECVIMNGSKVGFKKFKVFVKEKPHRVLSLISSKTNVTEGESLTLNACVTPSNAQVIWLMNGATVTSECSRMAISENVNGVRQFTITGVSLSDAGEYSCAIKNDKCSINITVIENKMKILEGLENITLFEGEEALFSVKLSKRPKKKPTWKVNKKTLIASATCQVTEKDRCHSIIMKKLHAEDSGDITFSADDITCYGKLTVKKLGFVETDGNAISSHVFSEGDHNVELLCQLYNQDAVVEWRKDGKLIELTDKTYKIVSAGCQRKIIISDVISDTAGRYDCTILSEYKSTKQSFKVSVREQYQQITKRLPSNIGLYNGDLLQLEIEVDPSHAEVRWFKDTCILALQRDESKVKLENIGAVRKLEILQVTSEDSGVYSCETIHDTCSTEVIIAEPTIQVIEHLESQQCEIGGSTSFQVKISRKTKHLPKWKWNETVIVPSEDYEISCTPLLFTITLNNVKENGELVFEVEDVRESASLIVTPPPAKFLKHQRDEVTGCIGNDVDLICELTSSNSPVRWYKDGHEVVDFPNITTQRGGCICKVKIRDAVDDDAGLYECRSDVDAITFKVRIEEPPLYLVEGMDDSTMLEGDEATFTVTLSQSPDDIMWMKNGEILKEKRNRIAMHHEDCCYKLNIEHLKLSDGGEVKLVVGEKTIDYAMLLVRKPRVKFAKELQDIVANLKEDVELICEVTDMTADVRWYRNDAEIDHSNNLNMTITSDGVQRRLYISPVYLHHEAKYSCATNDLIRTSAELFVKEMRRITPLLPPLVKASRCLIVPYNTSYNQQGNPMSGKHIPPVHFVIPLRDVRAYVGDVVEFKVKLSNPEVEGKWMVDSENVTSCDEVEIGEEMQLKILRLLNVSHSSVVTYRVDKNVTTSCRLDVRDRPVVIERRLSDVSVREGKDVTFECYFSKAELPAKWYIDEEVIEECDKYEVFSEGCKHTLKVRDVRYDDEASYSCRYKHRRTSSDLTVLEPHVDVIEPLTDVDGYIGDECKLTCVLSLPVVMATWCKDGRAILGANSRTIEEEKCVKHELIISALSRASNGMYSLTHCNKTLTTAEIRVKKDRIKIMQPLTDVIVDDVTEPVVLTCKFSQSSSVTWRCNGTLVEENEDCIMGSDGLSHSLTFLPQGRCLVSCSVPDHCETTCGVHISELELVKGLPEQAEMTEGCCHEFECIFSRPVSSHDVTLILDDEIIDDKFMTQHNTSVTYSMKSLKLRIDNVGQLYDNKKITMQCQSVSSCCRCRIISVPFAPTHLAMTDQNTDVLLQWSNPLQDESCPITDYVVEAKLVDLWEQLSCDIVYSEDKCTITTLLQNLTPDLAYAFRVAAVNKAGMGKYALFPQCFIPAFPLAFEKELDSISIIEGGNIELWCELTRPSSEPTWWTHDGVKVEQDGELVCFYDYDVTRELVIEQAVAGNTGEYSCQVGEATSKCYVVVHLQPIKFLKECDDITVKAGDGFDLTCKVSSDIKDVIWKKNGVILNKSEKLFFAVDNQATTLTLRSCNRSDAGVYCCCVTGEEGNEAISTEANVEIIDAEGSEMYSQGFEERLSNIPTEKDALSEDDVFDENENNKDIKADINKTNTLQADSHHSLESETYGIGTHLQEWNGSSENIFDCPEKLQDPDSVEKGDRTACEQINEENGAFYLHNEAAKDFRFEERIPSARDMKSDENGKSIFPFHVNQTSEHSSQNGREFRKIVDYGCEFDAQDEKESDLYGRKEFHDKSCKPEMFGEDQDEADFVKEEEQEKHILSSAQNDKYGVSLDDLSNPTGLVTEIAVVGSGDDDQLIYPENTQQLHERHEVSVDNQKGHNRVTDSQEMCDEELIAQSDVTQQTISNIEGDSIASYLIDHSISYVNRHPFDQIPAQNETEIILSSCSSVTVLPSSAPTECAKSCNFNDNLERISSTTDEAKTIESLPTTFYRSQRYNSDEAGNSERNFEPEYFITLLQISNDKQNQSRIAVESDYAHSSQWKEDLVQSSSMSEGEVFPPVQDTLTSPEHNAQKPLIGVDYGDQVSTIKQNEINRSIRLSKSLIPDVKLNTDSSGNYEELQENSCEPRDLFDNFWETEKRTNQTDKLDLSNSDITNCKLLDEYTNNLQSSCEYDKCNADDDYCGDFIANEYLVESTQIFLSDNSSKPLQSDLNVEKRLDVLDDDSDCCADVEDTLKCLKNVSPHESCSTDPFKFEEYLGAKIDWKNLGEDNDYKTAFLSDEAFDNPDFQNEVNKPSRMVADNDAQQVFNTDNSDTSSSYSYVDRKIESPSDNIDESVESSKYEFVRCKKEKQNWLKHKNREMLSHLDADEHVLCYDEEDSISTYLIGHADSPIQPPKDECSLDGIETAMSQTVDELIVSDKPSESNIFPFIDCGVLPQAEIDKSQTTLSFCSRLDRDGDETPMQQFHYPETKLKKKDLERYSVSPICTLDPNYSKEENSESSPSRHIKVGHEIEKADRSIKMGIHEDANRDEINKQDLPKTNLTHGESGSVLIQSDFDRSSQTLVCINDTTLSYSISPETKKHYYDDSKHTNLGSKINAAEVHLKSRKGLEVNYKVVGDVAQRDASLNEISGQSTYLDSAGGQEGVRKHCRTQCISLQKAVYDDSIDKLVPSGETYQCVDESTIINSTDRSSGLFEQSEGYHDLDVSETFQGSSVELEKCFSSNNNAQQQHPAIVLEREVSQDIITAKDQTDTNDYVLSDFCDNFKTPLTKYENLEASKLNLEKHEVNFAEIKCYDEKSIEKIPEFIGTKLSNTYEEVCEPAQCSFEVDELVKYLEECTKVTEYHDSSDKRAKHYCEDDMEIQYTDRLVDPVRHQAIADEEEHSIELDKSEKYFGKGDKFLKLGTDHDESQQSSNFSKEHKDHAYKTAQLCANIDAVTDCQTVTDTRQNYEKTDEQLLHSSKTAFSDNTENEDFSELAITESCIAHEPDTSIASYLNDYSSALPSYESEECSPTASHNSKTVLKDIHKQENNFLNCAMCNDEVVPLSVCNDSTSNNEIKVCCEGTGEATILDFYENDKPGQDDAQNIDLSPNNVGFDLAKKVDEYGSTNEREERTLDQIDSLKNLQANDNSDYATLVCYGSGDELSLRNYGASCSTLESNPRVETEYDYVLFNKLKLNNEGDHAPFDLKIRSNGSEKSSSQENDEDKSPRQVNNQASLPQYLSSSSLGFFNPCADKLMTTFPSDCAFTDPRILNTSQAMNLNSVNQQEKSSDKVNAPESCLYTAFDFEESGNQSEELVEGKEGHPKSTNRPHLDNITLESYVESDRNQNNEHDTNIQIKNESEDKHNTISSQHDSITNYLADFSNDLQRSNYPHVFVDQNNKKEAHINACKSVNKRCNKLQIENCEDNGFVVEDLQANDKIRVSLDDEKFQNSHSLKTNKSNFKESASLRVIESDGPNQFDADKIFIPLILFDLANNPPDALNGELLQAQFDDHELINEQKNIDKNKVSLHNCKIDANSSDHDLPEVFQLDDDFENKLLQHHNEEENAKAVSNNDFPSILLHNFIVNGEDNDQENLSEQCMQSFSKGSSTVSLVTLPDKFFAALPWQPNAPYCDTPSHSSLDHHDSYASLQVLDHRLTFPMSESSLELVPAITETKSKFLCGNENNNRSGETDQLMSLQKNDDYNNPLVETKNGSISNIVKLDEECTDFKDVKSVTSFLVDQAGLYKKENCDDHQSAHFTSCEEDHTVSHDETNIKTPRLADNASILETSTDPNLLVVFNKDIYQCIEANSKCNLTETVKFSSFSEEKDTSNFDVKFSTTSTTFQECDENLINQTPSDYVQSKNDSITSYLVHCSSLSAGTEDLTPVHHEYSEETVFFNVVDESAMKTDSETPDKNSPLLECNNDQGIQAVSQNCGAIQYDNCFLIHDVKPSIQSLQEVNLQESHHVNDHEDTACNDTRITTFRNNNSSENLIKCVTPTQNLKKEMEENSLHFSDSKGITRIKETHCSHLKNLEDLTSGTAAVVTNQEHIIKLDEEEQNVSSVKGIGEMILSNVEDCKEYASTWKVIDKSDGAFKGDDTKIQNNESIFNEIYDEVNLQSCNAPHIDYGKAAHDEDVLGPICSDTSKRMSVSSTMSDTYETCTESVHSSEEYLSAWSETQTIHGNDEDDNGAVLAEELNLIISSGSTTDDESLCTVSSFRSNTYFQRENKETTILSVFASDHYILPEVMTLLESLCLKVSSFIEESGIIYHENLSVSKDDISTISSNQNSRPPTALEVIDDISHSYPQLMLPSKSKFLPGHIDNKVTVDPKTGDVVTICTHVVSSSTLVGAKTSRLADLELPHETAEEKMARLFGDNSIYQDNEMGDNDEKDNDTGTVLSSSMNRSKPEDGEMTKNNVEEIMHISTLADEREAELHQSENYSDRSISVLSTNKDGCSSIECPMFTHYPHDEHVCEGDTARFHCIVQASEANVIWRKINVEGEFKISNGDGSRIFMKTIRLNDGAIDYVLRVYNANSEDAGLYLCEASNGGGTAEVSAMLTVSQDIGKEGPTFKEVAPQKSNVDEVHPTWNDSENSSTFLDLPTCSSPSCSLHLPENSDKQRETSSSSVCQRPEKGTPLPLQIHVLESIVVREKYVTSDDTDSLSSHGTPFKHSPHRREFYEQETARYSCELPVPTYESRSDEDMFVASDSSCFMCYAVTTRAAEDLSSVDLRLGDAVEVLDDSSNVEWLVRTKSSAENSCRVGFVDPVYLSSRLLTPSPVPSPVFTNNHLAHEIQLKEETERQESTACNDTLEKLLPSLMTKSYLGTLENSRNSREKNLLANLVQEEEDFITYLQRGSEVINNVAFSPIVEERFFELFGDIDGIADFHASVILPSIKASLDAPFNLCHMFLRYSGQLEQIHMSHVINTGKPLRFLHKHEVIANELSILSQSYHMDFTEISSKPMQQLILYQYYLKKLIHYNQKAIYVRPLRDTVALLADIPYKGRLNRMWQNTSGKPHHTDHFGPLLREGLFQLIRTDEKGFEANTTIRRAFLFKNFLTLVKVAKHKDDLITENAKFQEMYPIAMATLIEEPMCADARTFLLKFDDQHRAPLILRCQSLAGKRTWCRELERVMKRGYTDEDKSLFLTKLQDVSVVRGNPLDLFCYINGKALFPMEWRKDQRLLRSDNHVILTELDNGYNAIHIDHVTMEDRGVYKCVSMDDVTMCIVTVTDNL